MTAHGATRGTARCLALVAVLSTHAAPAQAEVRPYPARLPTVRLRLGPVRHLTETVATEQVPAVQSGTSLALDVALGYPVWLFLSRKHESEFHTPLDTPILVAYPEISYSYQRPGRHLFTAGGYLGGGVLWGFASYGIRFVAGADHDGRALGLRHSIGAHFLLDLFSIELAHQPLWVADQLQHDLIAWFAFNPLSATGALMSF